MDEIDIDELLGGSSEDEEMSPISRKAEKFSLSRLKDSQISSTQASSVPLLSDRLQSMITASNQPTSILKRTSSSKRKRLCWGDEKTGGSLVEEGPAISAKETSQAAASKVLKWAAETPQRPDKVKMTLVAEVSKPEATGTKVTLQTVAADAKGSKKAAVEQLQTPENSNGVEENSVKVEKTSTVEVVKRKRQQTKNKVGGNCVGCKETSDDSREDNPYLLGETPVTKRTKLKPLKMRGLEETGDWRLWSPKKSKEVGRDDAKRSSGKIRSRSTDRLVPGNNTKDLRSKPTSLLKVGDWEKPKNRRCRSASLAGRLERPMKSNENPLTEVPQLKVEGSRKKRPIKTGFGCKENSDDSTEEITPAWHKKKFVIETAAKKARKSSLPRCDLGDSCVACNSPECGTCKHCLDR